jgi:hypothetical protein
MAEGRQKKQKLQIVLCSWIDLIVARQFYSSWILYDLMQVILLHLILSIFERWGVLEVCHAGFITQTLHRDFRRFGRKSCRHRARQPSDPRIDL